MITTLAIFCTLLVCVCGLLTAVVFYLLYKRPLKKKHKRKTDFKRNEIEGNWNTQAAGHVINHHYGNEKHIEFLQETIVDMRNTIDRIYCEKEKLKEENDAIWNELLTLKDEIMQNRMPLLEKIVA